MNVFRMVLAVLLPPLAVWDKGCGTVLLVTLLTLLFWLPGAVVAMYIVVRAMQRIPPPMDDHSNDILSAAQSFKSQPLAAPPSNSPFDPAPPFSTQRAMSADPFATARPPAQRPPTPFESNPPPWTDTPPAAPADPFDEPSNNPPLAPPPARPKPPWES